jgi:hypothetical protein
MAIHPNIIAAALLLAAIPMAAANAATAPAERACFAANNWEGWSSPGDGDALLLRVGVNDIYRVELTPGTHVHKRGDQFIVNRIRGSNWICSALDLDLDLSDHHGFRQPLIARSLRKLAPAEVAAIPRKDLP